MRNCSGRFMATRAATVARLRSRLERSLRSQTSPKSTLSVRSASLGARSPIIFWATEGSLLIVTPLQVARGDLIVLPRHSPVFIWVRRLHDQVRARELVDARQLVADKRPHQCALNVKGERVSVLVDRIFAEGGFVAALRVLR